jgi:hypothetical protein
MVSSRALDGVGVGGKAIHGIVLEGGQTPVHGFLEHLGEPDLSDFYARFGKIVTAPGWAQMGNWFKPLRHASNVWQVSSSTHRLLGFRYGDFLILTNGFKKAGGETPIPQIRKSEELQKEFKKGRA